MFLELLRILKNKINIKVLSVKGISIYTHKHTKLCELEALNPHSLLPTHSLCYCTLK